MASQHLPLTAVVFDCDGVLVDTEPLHYRAFQEVLGPLGLGHDYEHYLRYYIGFDDRDAFLYAFEQAGRSLDGDTLAGLMRDKAKALQRIAEKGLSTFPGVISLVRGLAAAGVPLAVASGALRHEVEFFASVLGIRDAFPVIVAADDVTRSKPDPETYLKALDRISKHFSLNHVNPRTCVAIEDTPAGIQSARSAGLFAVAVTHSYPASELLNIADYVVESLTELNVEKLRMLVGS